MILSEQFRPATLDAVVGQGKIAAKLAALKARSGLAGRAYWLSGSSGTGKTTIAKIVANEVADEYGIEEFDAAGCTVAELESLERSVSSRCIGKGGRAVIVNEAHALRKACIRQLLVMLERIPRHVVYIFTTTSEGQDALFEDCDDATPLLSRCLRLDLARRDLKTPLATSIVAMCRTVPGLLNGKPDAYYVGRAELFLQKNKNNARSLWQAIECGYLTDADHDE